MELLKFLGIIIAIIIGVTARAYNLNKNTGILNYQINFYLSKILKDSY